MRTQFVVECEPGSVRAEPEALRRNGQDARGGNLLPLDQARNRLLIESVDAARSIARPSSKKRNHASRIFVACVTWGS